MGRGDRDRDRDRDRKRSPKDAARRGKKKVCVFCTDHITWVDYKDVNLLRRFMSDRGKIRSRRVSGNCSQHQSAVATAIKTARELALLPYTQRASTERGPRRGSRDSFQGAPGARGPGTPTMPPPGPVGGDGANGEGAPLPDFVDVDVEPDGDVELEPSVPDDGEVAVGSSGPSERGTRGPDGDQG